MIVLHRWMGLVMAAFLIVAGVTGSVIAFYSDLDAALNPALFRVYPPPGAQLLDPLELRERVQAQLPGAKPLAGAILHLRPGRSVNYWIDERETFVDPYSGKILGSRKFGDITEGRKNLLTFIYRLHHSLALGDVGSWIFGVIAVLWTIDCFVGAYLTFPPRAARASGTEKIRRMRRSWLARWLPSWLLKTTKLFSLVFTWHRASGLWVWLALLMFAWSAVALNLGDQVYAPVMNLIVPGAPHQEPPAAPEPRATPKLDMAAARSQGRRLIAEAAVKRGFAVISERFLDHDRQRGTFSYTVESTLDIDERLAETSVTFDADDGKLLSFHAPTGQITRETIDAWLVALHFGAVRELGVVYRAFVCVMGALVVFLSVTGVWIWWRKRRKRTSVSRGGPADDVKAPNPV